MNALVSAVHNLYRVPHSNDVPDPPPTDLWILRSGSYARSRRWIVEHETERSVVTAIKLSHTVIFALLMSLVLYVSVSGIRGRFNRRTTLSMIAIISEALVITLNQGRCPLTVVVEDLGERHGSVSDIFLPEWVARHIPHVSTAFLALGFTGFLMRRLNAFVSTTAREHGGDFAVGTRLTAH